MVSPVSKTSAIDRNPLCFVFQYNPEMLTHTFSSLNSEEVAKQEEKQSASNKKVELINLNLELDATDQLEQPDFHEEIVKYGLNKALATLESIILSQSKTQNSTSPIVLFVWGPSRTIPVSLENVKIFEQAFDTYLNPIRVNIELVMRVLDPSEFKKGSIGHTLCLNHSNQRKALMQKYIKNKLNNDFSKNISSNIRSADQLSKTKHKSDIK